MAARQKKQEELDALSSMIEKSGKNAKFKPTVMTYNDVTNSAKPVESKKLKKEQPTPSEEKDNDEGNEQ